MANLPQRLPLEQMQTKWASQLNPILSNELLAGQMLSNVALINGTTAVNHGLGRKLTGWFVVGKTAFADIHDNQASNQHPDLTLSLTADAATTVALWVF